MNHIRCDVESATAFAAGGMNIHTADFLNGPTFVTINWGLPGLATSMRMLFETAWAQGLVLGSFMSKVLGMSLNQPKTATIAYIAIAPRMMQRATALLKCLDS